MSRKKQEESTNQMDAATDHRFNIRNIMKDIQFLGSSHMTWKERKEMENRKVVSLGGKPVKRQRLPLSVSKAVMKNQKKREEKKLEENMILGRFAWKVGGSSKGSTDKRRPEDRVLKSSEGHFKNGVLDVKHLFSKSPAKDNDFDDHQRMGNDRGNRGREKGGRGRGGGGSRGGRGGGGSRGGRGGGGSRGGRGGRRSRGGRKHH